MFSGASALLRCRLSTLFAVALLSATPFATTRAQTPMTSAPATMTDSALVSNAQRYFGSLNDGSLDYAMQVAGPPMLEAFPSKDKLQAVWAGIIAQTGALESLGVGTVETLGPQRIVRFNAKFAVGNFNAVVAFDDAGKVAGFAVRPKS